MNVPKSEKEIVIAFFVKVLLVSLYEVIFNLVYFAVGVYNIVTFNSRPLKKSYRRSRTDFMEAMKEMEVAVVLSRKQQAIRNTH